eukprot:s1020_g5.t1
MSELDEDELEPAISDAEPEDAAAATPIAPEAGVEVTADPRLEPCGTMDAWADLAARCFHQSLSFADLGERIMGMIFRAPTPLGRFFRQWCQPAQPPPGAEPCHQRRGDVLPIPPWLVDTSVEGVTSANQFWVWAIVVVLDYNYCAGWSKPICVPMEPKLTENQRRAVKRIAEVVDINILSADPVGTLGEARAALASKKFDYAGAPLEYMEDLVATKIEPAWPSPREAAIQPIVKYLSEETKQALLEPRRLLLPPDKMPHRAPRSRVRATDDEWFAIYKMAHERGMMKVVSDSDIPRDRMGHLITNGAGAVKKEKWIEGKRVMCQRFISILCPTNAVTIPLEGAQSTLPFIGTMTAIQLQEEGVAYMESEDLQSAFNLFQAPDVWLPFFAYSKRVDGAAFNLPAGTLVRPALATIPMGWHSAVGLVQEAVRFLVFERCGVPRHMSVEKGKPLPATAAKAVVYLDNFDEVHIVQRLSEQLKEDGPAMSQYHERFVQVCDEDGLPRAAGKQLIHAVSGGLQGGFLDGEHGVLRVAPDKLRNFVRISGALLASKRWSEFHLRHWTGKAAFVAAFKRLLFSNLFEMFPLIELARKGDISPTRQGVDEILCVMLLSVISQANLRAQVSPEISCTDASPTGGATAVACKFKSRFLEVPDAQLDDHKCAWCEEDLDDSELTFPCSRRCGLRSCSPMCAFSHEETSCARKDLDSPAFGERFAGKNFPLTVVVCAQGIAIQPPLDIKIQSYRWDFFTEDGKRRLDAMEADNSLAASHWAPECKTFTAVRGRPIRLKSGRVIQGPRALRSKEKPWGLPNLTKDENIQVRQGNGMGKRSLQGFKDGLNAGRIVSLEHPWNSLIWDTPEALELIEDPRVFVACFSNCCFGGRRRKWTCLITSDPAVAEALHRPHCPGHDWLQPYEVHETPEGLRFDTEEEAEYPWGFCQAYAMALKETIGRRTPQPVGLLPRDHLMAIFSAVKRATKGLQQESVAMRVAREVNTWVQQMVPGKEQDHLAKLVRHVSTRGCDIKLQVDPEDGQFTLMAPYPAFVWLWRTLVAYRWSSEQHINCLEVAAFLVEIRRRARDITCHQARFINVTDSQVTFHALTKGRSSSPRLNRLIRRVAAVSFAADLAPFHLWTISKWNFADHGSRKFEKK